MCDRRKQAWIAVFISNALIHTVIIANPIYVPQFQPGKQAEIEQSPITTTNGCKMSWIINFIIQSPTTEKSPSSQESTTEPVAESTIQSSTSAKPITESTTIPEITKKPMTTTLPTIAGVTSDMELPVSMETLNMSDYKQVCGRRPFPEPRIVGGNQSSFGKSPWQISLHKWESQSRTYQQYMCGAVLINEKWAITTAFCVIGVPPSNLLLRFGEHDLANEDEPYRYQERKVRLMKIHPQIHLWKRGYNLALLKFDPLLLFQPNVLPICLPDDDETFFGRTAYVTGWSKLDNEGPLPSVLQEVAVPVINNTACEAMSRNAGYIEEIPHMFICAGWRNEYDFCKDGPMVIQRVRDKRWVLAGIFNSRVGCAVPNRPGVYTRISDAREWINQSMFQADWV